MGALILLASALLANQATRKTVTIEIKAASLDKVVARLANATGLKLATTAEMSREIVLISVHDAPVNEVLTRLAQVTTGLWVNDSGRYVLEPNGPERRAQADREFQARAQSMREFLKRLSIPKPLPKPEPKSSDPDDDWRQLDSFVPSEDVLLRAATEQLDPVQLAGMRPNGRLVLSTVPNSMQLPLNLPSSLVENFVRDHNAQRAVIVKFMQSKADDSAVQRLGHSMLERMNPIESSPGKALLVVIWNDFEKYPAIDLEFYNDKGALVYEGWKHLPSDENETPTFGLPPDMPNMEGYGKPITPGKGKPVHFSAASKELVKIFGSPRPDLSLTPETERVLLHPESHDPLSFIVSEALIATGADRQDQVIADIPDVLMLAFGMDVRKALATADFFDALSKMPSRVDLKETDGWLQIAPARGAWAREHRSDRQALSDFINAAHRQGTATLSDWASYAAVVDPPSDESFDQLYFVLFVPGFIAQTDFGPDAWLCLRLLGSFTDVQRSASQIPFRSFSAAQAAIVSEMLYDRRSGLKVQREAEPPGAADNREPKRIRDFKNEPTEACPNGLPSDGYLQFIRETQTVVRFAKPIPELYIVGGMDPTMYVSIATDPGFLQSEQRKAGLARMNVGKRVKYTLKFVLANDISMRVNLHEDWFASDAPIVSSKQLPEEFTKAALEESKRKKVEDSDPGREGMPPPLSPTR